MSALDDIIVKLNLENWRVHNLYQGTDQWEARIKHGAHDTAYGYGSGPTPFDALSAALEFGTARLNWRPTIADSHAVRTLHSATGARRTSTTDDLMGGLEF